MRQPYQKPNSQQQQYAGRMLASMYSILVSTGLNHTQWLDLMFETGCQLVEQTEPHPGVQRWMLQEHSLGFWPWWMQAYLQHDHALLAAYHQISSAAYHAEKQQFLKEYTLQNALEAIKNPQELCKK